MKLKTKKARITKALFYRPTLKLTTGLYEYASQYDSTSNFPDWHIGDKNRSVTLFNVEKNSSLFLSNVSIRFAKEIVDEQADTLFDDQGNIELKNINKDFANEFDIKVTRAIIAEFQEIAEVDMDYEEIVSHLSQMFLSSKGKKFSDEFNEFSNLTYQTDFKDDKGNILSVLIGPANKSEVDKFYTNHIVNKQKEEDLVIGNNNVYMRFIIRRDSKNGISIDAPDEEFIYFEGEIKKLRNKFINQLSNANKSEPKKKN